MAVLQLWEQTLHEAKDLEAEAEQYLLLVMVA